MTGVSHICVAVLKEEFDMLQNDLHRSKICRISVFIQSVFIMAWMSNLADTDSLYSVYALCSILCIFCLADNYSHRRLLPEKYVLPCVLFAAGFSVLTILANYSLFIKIWYGNSLFYITNIVRNVLNVVSSAIGGFFVAFNIIVSLLDRIPLRSDKTGLRTHPVKVFLIVFCSIVILDAIYLFFSAYPGIITPDSLYQIIQGYTNTYMNDHPFWNTLYVELILGIGYFISGSPNGAMALFSLIQILSMAACFAFAVMTLYQAGMPKWMLWVVFFLYALMPYNIVFSVSMYKDVPFALSVLLLVTTLYRMFHSIGKKQIWNYIIYLLGGFALCLSRTNGLLVFLIFSIFLLPYMYRHNKKLLIIALAILLIGGVLTGPVVDAFGVAKSEVTEAFSLPLQQMARVVSSGCTLSETQEAMLGRIFDLEEIPEIYVEWYADPIKLEVRENDNAYFAEHLMDYLKLWFELGIEHPWEYLKAWVEQTKGYWNGGYNYFQYVEMIQDNSYGFYRAAGNNIVAKLIDFYFGFTRQFVIFEPLNSIGLQVWIVGFCCFANALRKRKEYLLSVPALIIIAGLMIGTPVYAEFRYAYPVFMSCPFIVCATMYRCENV